MITVFSKQSFSLLSLMMRTLSIFGLLVLLPRIVDSQTAAIGNDNYHSSKKNILIKIEDTLKIIDLPSNIGMFKRNDILHLLDAPSFLSTLFSKREQSRQRIVFLSGLVEKNPELRDFVLRELLTADTDVSDSLTELKESISFIISHPGPTSTANLRATRDAQFNMVVDKYTRPYLRSNDIDLIALVFAIIELLKKF